MKNVQPMETTTYNFIQFWQNNATKQRIYPDGTIYLINGCSVFNSRILGLLSYHSANIPIPSTTTIINNIILMEDGTTAISRKPPVMEADVPRFILIESYCNGYHDGQSWIKEMFPNPSSNVMDIHTIRKQLHKAIATLPGIGSMKLIYDCGFHAGKLQTILDWQRVYKALAEVAEVAETPEGLTVNEFALKLTYESKYGKGRQVTRQNADVIIQEIGKKSGEKLFQRFIYYQSDANRTGKPNPSTYKKFQNKILMFQKVADLLSGNAKERAQNELKTLQSLFENEF
jgi:hypothetical protein